MLKARITYPKKQEERDIMRLNMLGGGLPKPNRVIAPEDILKAREVVSDVYMDEKIEKYIVDIIFATREPSEYNMARLASLISTAARRESISLAKAAKSCRLHQAARLRDPRGRARRMPRRAAAPDRTDLRS